MATIYGLGLSGILVVMQFLRRGEVFAARYHDVNATNLKEDGDQRGKAIIIHF